MPNTSALPLSCELIDGLSRHLEGSVFTNMASMPVFRQEIVSSWTEVLRPFSEVVDRIEKREPLVLFTGSEPDLEYLRYLRGQEPNGENGFYYPEYELFCEALSVSSTGGSNGTCT